MVDLERDESAFGRERADVLVLVRFVVVADVGHGRDGFHDPVESLSAEGRDAWRHDGDVRGRVFPQVIVECANALSYEVVHCDSPKAWFANRRRS
jgi:hypothetical protein